jgi:hypothetical protein
MAGTFTANYGFVLQGFNDNSGTWGTVGSVGPPAEPGLNNGVFSPLDAILGGNYTQTISAGSNSLSLANWVSAGIFILNSSGALSNNATFVLPLSATPAVPGQAVGGKFIVINNTTGPYGVSVLTAASGSTGVAVPQGFAVSLYSDMTNVSYADVGLPSFAQASNGNPNGLLAGVAGSVNTNAELAWDYVNSILYVCTFTGPATGGPGVQAQWTNPVSSGQTLPTPEGYLTPVSNTPIINSNSTGAPIIYYTPYVGSWAAVHNGTSVIPYKFSQMSLTLSASQAASNIYDVYLAYNGGTPVIGTGPSWAAGSAGSITAGSCARGTGGGGAAINRDSNSGLWVNTASMSLIYNTGGGNNTIAVAAGQGVLLGSIFIDTTTGQVSCLRSWGQSRKWGISNAYNRADVTMQGGDSTVNWTTASTWRSSNGNPANQITTFSCLPEEEAYIYFVQPTFNNTNLNGGQIAVGYNSTTAPVGACTYTQPQLQPNGIPSGNGVQMQAIYVAPPALGINNVNMIEQGASAGAVTARYFGTQANMLMTVRTRA